MMPQGFPSFQQTPPYNTIGHMEEPPWVKKLLNRIDSLDTKFSNMESEISRKLADFEKSITFMSNEFETLKTSVQSLEGEVRNIKKENCDLKQEMSALRESMVSDKARSMRNNLLFHGVPESKEENCEQTVRTFIKNKLNIEDSDYEIERAHRMGPYKRDKKRPIVARFLRYKDKESVKKVSYRLKGSTLGVSDQFPREVTERRAKLRPIEKEEKNRGQPAFFAMDKLYTTGWCHYVENGVVKKVPSRRPVRSPTWQHRQSGNTRNTQENPLITEIPDETAFSQVLNSAHLTLHGDNR